MKPDTCADACSSTRSSVSGSVRHSGSVCVCVRTCALFVLSDAPNGVCRVYLRSPPMLFNTQRAGTNLLIEF